MLSLQDLQVEEAAHTTFKTLDEVFPEGSTIFMLGLPHYGAQGAVSTRSSLWNLCMLLNDNPMLLFNQCKKIDKIEITVSGVWLKRP